MQVTKREELIEAYEDAWFALLMDDVAEMEGACWEERRRELENDPDAKVPKVADRKCLQTIDRYFARQKRRENLRKAKTVLKRIAVPVAMAAVLFSTALAVSEDARVATANLLITVHERYTELHIGTDLAEYQMSGTSDGVPLDDAFFSEIHVGWLPEGFSFYNGSPNMAASFENADGLFIAIDYAPAHTTYQIDTENADDIETMDINGYQVLKVLKNGTTNMVLINEEKSCFVGVLTSDGISPDIAIKIMENISFI